MAPPITSSRTLNKLRFRRQLRRGKEFRNRIVNLAQKIESRRLLESLMVCLSTCLWQDRSKTLQLSFTREKALRKHLSFSRKQRMQQ
jgi:hypothetical protein